MAGLTTHVLDTSKGAPAFNLKIELFKINKLEKRSKGQEAHVMLVYEQA